MELLNIMREEILPRTTRISTNGYLSKILSLRLRAFVRTILPIMLLSACSGMVRTGGEFLEGSARETELARYRSAETGSGKKKKAVEIRELILEDERWVLEISSGEWPGLLLRGSMPAGNGSFEFYEARVLSPHANGWNEFILDISGNGNFNNPLKAGGVLLIDGEIERIQIKSGKIRLKSSRFTGNSALTALRNRRERILALSEWMSEYMEQFVQSSQLYQAEFSDQPAAIRSALGDSYGFSEQKEFEKFWKPLLFPELASGSRRPPEYSTANAEWRRADSIRWNLSYTENLFPEELSGVTQFREYRNSGALLRDWEEALPWIYMEYAWDMIIKSFSDITLQKVSR